MDVKKEIIDLCNTKIFFQTQGSGSNYLREYFNSKQDAERLKHLPQGHAYITSKGKHNPVEIKFPYIN
jgi:DNA helicase HerA-like ATPase